MTPKKPTLTSLSRELKKLREDLPNIIADQLAEMRYAQRMTEQTCRVANPSSIPQEQKKYDTIEFPTLWLEMMKEDLPCGAVDKKTADEEVKKLWGGRLIPTDDQRRQMVESMEGEFEQDKVIAFVNLTNVSGWYWTDTHFSKDSFVIRGFIKDGRDRDRSYDSNDHYVRVVRSLLRE